MTLTDQQTAIPPVAKNNKLVSTEVYEKNDLKTIDTMNDVVNQVFFNTA